MLSKKKFFDFDAYSRCLNQFYQFGLGLSIFLTSDRLGMETCLETVICALSCNVSDAEIHTSPLNFSWSNLFPLPLSNKPFQLIKANTSTGKPNKWKPRREKLGLACIWLVRMPFGNTHTHTPGPFEYLSPLYSPTLGRHNEADALRKKRRV